MAVKLLSDILVPLPYKEGGIGMATRWDKGSMVSALRAAVKLASEWHVPYFVEIVAGGWQVGRRKLHRPDFFEVAVNGTIVEHGLDWDNGDGDRARGFYPFSRPYSLAVTNTQTVQHPDMAQLGPKAWAKLHAWADEFRAQVNGSCGCGEFAVNGMRAFHDLVNHHLGKPIRYPDDLKRMAAAFQEAAGVVAGQQSPSRSGDGVGENLGRLSARERREIWRGRKRTQRAMECPPGEERHHPDYRDMDEVVCLTPSEHRKASHIYVARASQEVANGQDNSMADDMGAMVGMDTGQGNHHVALSQRPDDYGSRCRDKSGEWTFSELCPPVETLVSRGKVIMVPPATASNRTLALSADGLQTYEFEHRIVEASALIPSHDPFTFIENPAFTQSLQPRSRERAAAEIQVKGISARLSPDSLLTDFHTLDRGAPIVGPDMLVESGNGRAMGIIRAIQEFPENYAAYRTALEAKSFEYGLSIGATKFPILVRVRLTKFTPQERQAFVMEANTPSGLTRSAIEQARTDGERITLAMLDALDIVEGESIFDALRAARNAGFVRSFMGNVPENERGHLLDAKGVINMDGVRRAAQAVFVSAFGSGEAGMRLGEMAFGSSDMDVRSAINAVSQALGPLAQMEAMLRARPDGSGLSIATDLAQAVSVYAKIRNDTALTVEKYLAQTQMLERELSPFGEAILTTLYRHRRSAKRMSTVLRAYAEAVINLPPPEQEGLFGPVELPSRESLWGRALEMSDAPALVVAQAVVGPRGSYPSRIRWCNTPKAAQDAIMLWRPLRNLIYMGIGYQVVVEVCEAGFGGGQYQVTIGYPQEGALRKGRLTTGQMQALRQATKGMGNLVKEVLTKDPGLLVFNVTFPNKEAADLLLKVQLPVEERDERPARAIEPVEQARLFQEETVEMNQHLLTQEDIGRMQKAVDKRAPVPAPVPVETITKSVVYERWSLNARGNGTVTYTRFAPDGGDLHWANEVGRVVQREKGGTYLAGERNATSIAEITFKVGAILERIIVSYSRGGKSGSTRSLRYLHGWDAEGKLDWREEKVPAKRVHLSQAFLDTVLHTALGTATSIGVAKALSASVVPGGVQPEPPKDPYNKEEEEKKKRASVYSPAFVEGDQAQVELGTLLQEIDEILKNPQTMGVVDAERLRVVRE